MMSLEDIAVLLAIIGMACFIVGVIFDKWG